MEPISFVVGLALIVAVGWDAFQTIVVPRPTPGRLRIAIHLTRDGWRAWRWVSGRSKPGLGRDRLLGMFAPAVVIVLLATWLMVLVLGYGLVLWAIRDELRPVPNDFGTALYFAGTSVLTLGFGDVVAAGPLARLVSMTAAATGLGTVALVVTYLFSLFGSYQRREVLVVGLQARAGAPPSAIPLLEKHARLDLVGDLPHLFKEWERWSAEVLDSHVAYPLLGFFRSSHDDLSWISALGAMLDAASLVTTTIVGVPRGSAYLMKGVGAHLVEDLTNFLHLVPQDGAAVDREAFVAVWDRLADAGFGLEPVDVAWPAFEEAREAYAGRLTAMADYWATPATVWAGRHRRPSSLAHASTETGQPTAAEPEQAHETAAALLASEDPRR